MKKEKKGFTKIITIILLLVIIALLVLVVFKTKELKEENESLKENVKNAEVIEKVEVLDVTSSQVVELYNSVDVFKGFLGSSDEMLNEYLGYFYKKDLIETKDISNQALLKIALGNIKEDDYKTIDTIGRYFISIPKIEVDKQIKKIFGDIEYKNEDVGRIPIGGYTYNSEKEAYEVTLAGGGFGYPLQELHTKIVKAEKNNNQITINVKYIYEYVNYTDKLIATYYSDLSSQNKIDYAEENRTQIDELFIKHSDKLSEHQFTFVNENGNYIFKNVKKIK